MHLDFTALELDRDGRLAPARYRFEDCQGEGWNIYREGELALRLGSGYRLLRSAACGVCATDLARQYLPFPLPQVIGHEVLARDEEGNWYVVEINSSHIARGFSKGCPYCMQGLGNHCPERLVLGIHGLPGGFGRFILAPINNVIAAPPELPLQSMVLVEPLAAALSAVGVVNPRKGDTVAVLGPRRLGMLVIAALAARRRQGSLDFEILALCRREDLFGLARKLGADRCILVSGADTAVPPLADVVVDTTGSPAGLELALRLARREVHLKSTHGEAAGGLRHLTEMVVDEISLRPFPRDGGERAGGGRLLAPAGPVGRGGGIVAWLARTAPPPEVELGAEKVLKGESAAELLRELEENPPQAGIARADVVVVDRASQIDEVLRPAAGREISLAKPRGVILACRANRAEAGGLGGTVWEAVASRGLSITTSRCGDFRAALALMLEDGSLAGVGQQMITHRFAGGRLADAFALAKSPQCVKVVVVHDRDFG